MRIVVDKSHIRGKCEVSRVVIDPEICMGFFTRALSNLFSLFFPGGLCALD